MTPETREAKEQAICQICDEAEMAFAWTDTHGVAQCFRCGTPYRILHYISNERVERPPAIQIKAEYIPLIRQYWSETKSRIPSGCSIPGGQELASREDARQFYTWMEDHKQP